MMTDNKKKYGYDIIKNKIHLYKEHNIIKRNSARINVDPATII